MPLRIALAQQNLNRGEELLMDVSHPESPNFGKHWTAQQVAEMFRPSQEAVDAVKTWLFDAGIAEERVKQSQGLSWVNLNATVDEAERLLQAKYHRYEHASGQPHIACESYSVPENVRPHVDFITPTVHFDAKILPRGDDIEEADTDKKSAVGAKIQPGVASRVGEPGSGSLPKEGPVVDAKDLLDEPKDCDKSITPACLRALYRFPLGTTSHPDNSYGIVEYTPQAYVQSDLDLFFKNFSSGLVGTSPKLASINGGVVQTTQTGFQFNGESNLDLEYAMALVAPQTVTLYQVGDLYQGASFNNFLDAIDGSYCTYQGGDDPTQDAVYPNSVFPQGFPGPPNCGTFAPANVISTSYGYNEADLTATYEQRQCNEYMKLGLQGVTMLFSSGDYGVAGNGNQCVDKFGMFNDGSSGKFNPGFPSTCPYVTSVGATQVNPGSSVRAPEGACQQKIYSGGGFSNVFGKPEYQAKAVDRWFAEHAPPYGAERFNNSQTVRGFPDVSANGANYAVTVQGNFTLVYGTSASAPTFGSIVTLINEARLSAGKRPVGFLNPTLYEHPDVLFDITSGGNRGCGTPGFEATEGWDPVTGLGTPNYPAMLELYMGLP
ncbi:MAG: hypothetical protein M1832_000134 [Thelocarpon impressellum]|nr:MAG: hypothetical protein M1832_000134 [Thelocarpon impressellum]